MANQEHIEIVKQGASTIAAWYATHRGEYLDLVEANLREANLRGTDLIRANLHGANLRGVDLGGCNLRESDLNEADLNGADLREAELNRTSLYNTELTGTRLGGTVFVDTNLADALGLDTCHHYGPSYLDHRTLARSGLLPLNFLRGCGLSDWEIETTKLHQANLPSNEVVNITYRIANLLTADPVQYSSCFISYSSADGNFCEKLHDLLQDAGMRVFYTAKDMRWGRKLFDQIDEPVQLFDKLLLILSEDSMRSAWVEYEIRTARTREQLEQRRILFPVRLVDFETIRTWKCFDADTGRDLATEMREYYIPADFSNWEEPEVFDHAFVRLLRDLRDDDTDRYQKVEENDESMQSPTLQAERRISAARNQQQLLLSNLGLTTVPKSLASLTQLRELDLRGNQLTIVPEILGQLTQLQYLYLSGNQLASLPEFLGNLTQLRELDLSGNQLTNLPEALGKLSQLITLDLSGNQLTNLPEALGKLYRLQHLHLSRNALTTLPESLGQLSRLQYIHLSRNQLTNLPKSLGQLIQSITLDLSGNQLTSVPEVLGQLTQLQHLHLNGNQLTSMPEFLGNLTQLRELDLSGNQLTNLPEALGQLPQLHNLKCSSNYLVTVPMWLELLPSLKWLDFSDNRIPVPSEILAFIRQPAVILAIWRFYQHTTDIRSLPASRIERAIEFPPEHHQAGLGILNYVSEILSQRYPDIPIAVRIEQQNLMVRVIIETPEGLRETMEQTLTDYGRVVAGNLQPDDLLTDPVHVTKLRNKFALVQAELEMERNMRQLVERQYEQRIQSLEDEVTHLRGWVGHHLQYTQQFIDLLQNHVEVQRNTAVQQALASLNRMLARQITAADESEAKAALTTLGHQAPAVLNRLAENVAAGTIGGAAGNLLAQWIPDVMRTLEILGKLAP